MTMDFKVEEINLVKNMRLQIEQVTPYMDRGKEQYELSIKTIVSKETYLYLLDNSHTHEINVKIKTKVENKGQCNECDD